MKYERTIHLSEKRLAEIEERLKDGYSAEEEETISETAVFDNGYEVDIKCCVAVDRCEDTTSVWTEAVLFKDGSEISCTEPSDVFAGDWEFQLANGDTYVVHVVRE